MHSIILAKLSLKNVGPIYLIRAMILLIPLIGCNGASTSISAPITDAGEDAAPAVDPDAAPADQDGGDIDDAATDEEPEGISGQACWNSSVFDQWHPNAGMPNCSDGLKCIGNSNEAWCTKSCDETGAINKIDKGLEQWCCGELTTPCDPQRYWLPASMQFHCIPRSAPLGGACERTTEWTGSQERCKAICNGGTLIQTTQCAPREGTPSTGFCTFACDPLLNHTDCTIEPAFNDGCCGDIMGGKWCLPNEMCQ